MCSWLLGLRYSSCYAGFQPFNFWLAGDEAWEQQAADQQVQGSQTAALSKQYGLVDGDIVSATAAHCNERKLAAKTVSVSICTSTRLTYMLVGTKVVNLSIG